MDGAGARSSGMRHEQGMVTGRFVRNAWYVAAWGEEVKKGELLARTILGEPVVMFRRQDGSIAALEDRCPHRFAPLSMGHVLPGDRVQCPYHGLEFGTDGACVHNPHGTHNIPSRARVASYTIVERHMAAWIWMGDKPADPARIPNFSVLDNVPELHVMPLDKISVKANYELVVDNLLDVSHTSYLHDGLLGNKETVESDTPVTVDGDDVIVDRYSPNATPPGMFAQFWPGHPSRIDKFSSTRWMAPCYLTLFTGICAPGAPKESGTGYHGIHMLTPEEHDSTHYFFTAVRWNVMTDDETNRVLRDKVAKLRRFAFEEQDGPVIERQQIILNKASRRLDPVILSVDVGPVRYKRVLERMLAAEAERSS
jgi:phenylpropionate dioxygenase-like ring-hydroxylating dioxygenase large terminal subunit